MNVAQDHVEDSVYEAQNLSRPGSRIESHTRGNLTAEESVTRDAILDVLDDEPWDFDAADYLNGRTVTEDEANAERLDFADQVILRARQIKQVDEAEYLRKRKEACEVLAGR